MMRITTMTNMGTRHEPVRDTKNQKQKSGWELCVFSLLWRNMLLVEIVTLVSAETYV